MLRGRGGATESGARRLYSIRTHANYSYAYLFICLSICLSGCLSICLSVYLSIPLSVYLQVWLGIKPSLFDEDELGHGLCQSWSVLYPHM